MAGESYNTAKFRLADGYPSREIELPAAASQTWAKGDFLTLDTGLVALAGAASTELIGIAGDDRTSTTANDEVPVVGSEPDARFVGRADADPSSLVIGDQVDLVGNSGAQMVDVGATATDVFTFIRTLPDETSTAQYAEVLVSITHGKHGLQ